MANIQTPISGWSTTEASNQPDGTDSATIAGDLRAIQAGVRYLYAQDTIASASTCDIGAKSSASLAVSGTTTITSFGTVSAGIRKILKFDGALTLTHNGTSLILPGAANITTAANDTAEFESLGSGNWRCNWYKRQGVAPGGVSDGDKGDITVASSGTSWTIDANAVTSTKININGATEDTAPDKSADFVMTYDASGAANKKVKLQNLNIYQVAAVSASSTSVDFTGIPSWVKRITINLDGISTNGTSNPIIQLGDSGGVEATTYVGTAFNISAATGSNLSSGFILWQGTVAAATTINGSVILSLSDASNTWTASGVIALSNSANVTVVSGYKATSATLDRVRLTTSGGADTFDAGTINILYE